MQRIETQQTVSYPFSIGVWSLMIVAVLAGCSGAPKVTGSGFLPDYSLL